VTSLDQLQEAARALQEMRPKSEGAECTLDGSCGAPGASTLGTWRRSGGRAGVRAEARGARGPSMRSQPRENVRASCRARGRRRGREEATRSTRAGPAGAGTEPPSAGELAGSR